MPVNIVDRSAPLPENLSVLDRPILTIGFAFFEDFKGLWFTLQHLGMCEPEVLRFCKIVVVNDAPGSPQSARLNRYINSWVKDAGWAGVKVVDQPKNMGPGQAKNRVFKESETDWTLCMDSHVLLPPGTLSLLLGLLMDFKSHPYTADSPPPGSSPIPLGTPPNIPHPDDLFSGPIIYDSLQSLDTNLAPIWRGDAWGTWESNPAGRDLLAPPFEIWDMGHGLMLSRTKSWLGFHPEVYSFGAEEGCLAEWYRANGRKVWCLPFLRWNHFFSDGDVTYPRQRYHKVRNYVLEFQRLQSLADKAKAEPTNVPSPSYTPPSLDEIHRHMVSLEHPGEHIIDHLNREHSVELDTLRRMPEEQLRELHTRFKITQAQWEYLLEDPVGHRDPPNTLGLPLITSNDSNPLDTLFKSTVQTERDLNRHMVKLREIASKSNRITEFTRRVESSIAFLSARPKFLRTYVYGDESGSPVLDQLYNATVKSGLSWAFTRQTGWQPGDIEDCELFFLKCPHDYHDLEQHLKNWEKHFKKYVAIHDTVNHAERWHDGDGGIGLRPGIEAFLQRNPTWRIIYHSVDQYGLTILSNEPTEFPEESIIPWSPGYGPGTELKKILESFGITGMPGCDCAGKQQQMDKWGVEGCKLHKQTIIQWMREGSERWGYSQKFRQLASNPLEAVKLAFKVSWVDPFPGLIDEAIRKAERNQPKPLTVPLRDPVPAEPPPGEFED